MPNSEAYLERAAECLRSARSAQTGREREGYLNLADGWRRLAAQARALEQAAAPHAGEGPAAPACGPAATAASLPET